MPVIEPSVTKQQIICAETPGEPCGLVVFGASGDLTRRKLLDSLFQLYLRDLLAEQFYFVGCGRKPLSDDDYRDIARQSIAAGNAADEQVAGFLERIHFISGNYDDPAFYEAIKTRLDELDEKFGVGKCHIFYLAVPPTIYGTITDGLGRAGLAARTSTEGKCPQARLVVEKPFGIDLETAIALNDQITRSFSESQIYRIDHYLGKETVQNILMFRFANAIFEPLWNRNYIDHVQITIAESIGIDSRGGYYDQAGALRDMFQNHMLGMLALMAMEPPTSFEADDIRDEKVKLLRSIRPLELDSWTPAVVAGQYTAGAIDGEDACGYLQESAIGPDSTTETFIAAKLFIDNWRWKDVPFYLRTGKRLATRLTEIAITFKNVPHSMFASVGLDEMPENVLVLKIQPNEGINLSFQAKRPGSKACMSTLTMNFNYSDVFETHAPEAYQRLLLDCMVADQTLFTRQDDVEVAWQLLTPILQKWAKDQSEPFQYPAGAESFSEADALIQAGGHSWRKLLQK